MTSAVFAKTPKGIQEIETKANGLSVLERRVLIFIDGKRTFEDLKTLPRIDDLHGIITLLEVGGYIAIANAPTQAVPIQLASSTSPPLATQPPTAGDVPNTFSQPHSSTTTFRGLPATFDRKTFEMAKNFMVNTLNAFTGFYGATGLVRRIEHTQTHEELRTLFDEWFHTIDNTRKGHKQGDELRQKLLEVI